MLSLFRCMARNNTGATAIDYSLIAAIVAVAGVSALHAIGSKTTTVMNTIGNAL